ncbi:MAG: glycosyltransferase, partial [Bacilli bacterium]
GEQEEELKKLSKSLNIEKRTIFLGFRKDLEDLYKLADVFFFPSLQEGLSVALLGAMASGLPVVCSNIRGNIDLIEDGKGGYIFDPMDSKGFALGLSKILENSNDFGEYNNSVVGKFEVNKVVEVMNSIVTEVLER